VVHDTLSLLGLYKMQIKPKHGCPLNSFKPCKELECAWFTQVRGTNPNTGKEVDEWACAMSWLPMLLIENSQQQRQTGAAVESFRNEMVKANETGQQLLITAAKQNRLLGE
jgi:hypothetical protein